MVCLFPELAILDVLPSVCDFGSPIPHGLGPEHLEHLLLSVVRMYVLINESLLYLARNRRWARS